MSPQVLIFALLFLFNGATVEAFTGEVVGAPSGDTIEVQQNGKAQRFHLYGIDCPMKGQPYDNNARETILMMSFALDVTLLTHGKDQQGRILAEVVLADQTNINQKLVKGGLCWWDRQHASENTIFEALEAEARRTKTGLWVDPSPVPPWEWRKRGK